MMHGPRPHAIRPVGLPRLKILGESPKAFHIQSLSAEGHPIGGPMFVARLGMTPDHEQRIRMLASEGDPETAPTESISTQGKQLRENRKNVEVSSDKKPDDVAPKPAAPDPSAAPLKLPDEHQPASGEKKVTMSGGGAGGSGKSDKSLSNLLGQFGQKHTPLYNMIHPEEAALDKRHNDNLLEQAHRNQDKEDAAMAASNTYLTGSGVTRTTAGGVGLPNVDVQPDSPAVVGRGTIFPDVESTTDQGTNPVPPVPEPVDPVLPQNENANPDAPITSDLSPNTGADFSPQTNPFAVQLGDQLEQSDFANAAPVAEEAHGGEISGPHIIDEDADTVTVRLAQGGQVKVPRWGLHPEMLKAMPRVPKARKMADGGESESVDDGIARMNALSQGQRQAAARHTAQGTQAPESAEAQDESAAFETPTASQAAQNEMDNIRRRAADEQERAASAYRATHGPQKTIDGEDFDPPADQKEARGGVIRRPRMLASEGDPQTAPAEDLPIEIPSTVGALPDEHAAAVAQEEQNALGRAALRQMMNPPQQSRPEQAGIPLFGSSEPTPETPASQQSVSPSTDAVNTSQQTPVPLSGAAPIDITHALASYQPPEKPAAEQPKPTPAASILAASSAPSGGGMPRIDTTADDKSIKEARDFQAAAIGNQQVDAASIGDDLRRIEAQRAANSATIKAHFAKEYDGIQAKANGLRDQIASGDINPHQYWDNKGLGSKVTATLAMALGAFGASISKTPNYAQAIITKAVDDDIDAQKANLGKKESLLNNYMKAGYDVQHAEELAKADLNDVIAGQMRQMSAAHAGAQAGIAADAASSKLSADSMRMRQNALLAAEQKAETQSKLMTDKAQRDKIAYEIWAAKQAQGAAPAATFEPAKDDDPVLAADRVLTWKDPKEAAGRLVNVVEKVQERAPDGHVVMIDKPTTRFTASSKEDPSKLRADSLMLKQQEKALSNMRRLTKDGSWWSPTDKESFLAEANLFNMASPRTLDEINRFTGNEAEMMRGVVDPAHGLGLWDNIFTNKTKAGLDVADKVIRARQSDLNSRLRPRDSLGRP